MTSLIEANESACPCGATTFSVKAKPLARFFCHCLICQSIYKKPFADVVAFWAGGEQLRSAEAVEFKRYRPPPALRRATCRACGAPVLGYLRLAPFVRVLFVPTRNLMPSTGIPEPAAHIFYHRCVSEVSDTLPKHRGYWSSELAVTKLLLASALGG